MAKTIRGKSQAKKDRVALRKLKSTGLYKGKVDLRKKPSKYQQQLISKYKDVLTGRAVVVKPKAPSRYRGIYKVSGDSVIVPRRKGEKVTLNKKGEIVRKRRIGRVREKGVGKFVRSDAELSREPGTQFWVPFIRGRDAKGDPVLEWKHFPSREILLQIMGTYEHREKGTPYTDWRNYVVEARVTDTQGLENPDPVLRRQLNKKTLMAKKKLRFKDNEAEGE